MIKSKIAKELTPPEVLQAINVIEAYLKRGGWCEAIISDRGSAAFRLTSVYGKYDHIITPPMTEPTTQPTLDWRYPPELPPEPPPSKYTECLVAAEAHCGDVILEVVLHAWYDGVWIVDEPVDVYAWAEWPTPPTKGKVG